MAVILGAAILSDHITAQIVGGMFIVLFGVAITRRDRRTSHARPVRRRSRRRLAMARKSW